MASVVRKSRWYCLSPDRLVVGLFTVQVFLLLSEQFQWFSLNERKGWTVLIATAVLCSAVTVMSLWFVASLVLRGRFQFGLRSFLLLVLAVAVQASWFASQMRQAEKQRRVVAAIRAAGGRGIRYDYEWNSLERFRETGYDSASQPPAPEWLMERVGEGFFADVVFVGFDRPLGRDDLDWAHLKGLIHLRYLSLDGGQVTDAELVNIEGLTSLVILHLGATQVTDAGLVHLQGLPRLRELWLDDTQITDAGLRHLKPLTCLKDLRLSGTLVTDVGLVNLQGLTKLAELTLDRTQITGTGMGHLEGLPDLEGLHLANTHVTDAGLEHLKRLTNLKWVSLEKTQITDAGLVHLKGMSRLEVVNVRGTQVTQEAFRDLRDVLQNKQSTVARPRSEGSSQ